MDKKLKLKTELKKKLKQETSVTGTGASVTPGSGEGVATKYAFGKRKNKGTPSNWKSAPSVPNRPSKAMDYKELWEVERDQEVKITSGPHTGKTAVVHDFDSEKDSASGDDWVDVLIGSKKEKKTVKASELKPLQETEDNLEEAKQEWAVKNIEAMITDYASKKGLNFKPVDKKQQVNQYGSKKTIYIYKLGDKDLIMIDDKAAGAPRLNDFRVGIGTMEPGSSSLKDALSVSKFGSWGVQDIITMLDKAFKNEENLNENYARFRNKTKTRSKPDQFHQAVKEVKKKMNEINRIFEYVDRLKTELSEGEDLKYKKYTENAFQQIKESAKQLFLKSTKLK